ncbi:bacillithiol biosynthesis cysteine-adding enzyme BshC [Mucilaginibacter ginkgonis]|uniref:Putative cysteine ligase BshC n=1 Tax=Mucilaginibacter ginkgonis TaxID=2682091 RepID=A0A6I4HZJ9_9SPHI|nr:bacillithiol biosynthesis cysteine-adding enzyme BshC [Mucilaginibacter ginkgonis]QQL48698.1 bacillithiol biosynthesis cysteine-adding enzyme BshC [Mucilaginibacter ginkgonis]
MDIQCISYKETGYFSKTVTDYLDNAPALEPFYTYRPNLDGFTQILKDRKVTANRELLVTVLNEQYDNIKNVDAGAVIPHENIDALADENTFTVTTGHQLNIFTGPLYFIYKIVTAIKLASQLGEHFPDKKFVPVYWMATEDHDFAEINYTNIGGKKVQWNLEAAGATGRLDTKTIREALNQYKGVLGIEGHGEELAQLVETAYTKFNALAGATRYLVNALFGKYGVVIIDADDSRLKKEFAPIIEQDIIGRNSFKQIGQTIERLNQLHVPIQVNPREINFFYLTDGSRERIVFEDGRYQVLNTDTSFTEDKLKAEIAAHPERFSPNVAMRPVYQEYILPNLAYIGGGGELVYWLELKSVFNFYRLTFPVLILRNSGLVIRKDTAAKIRKMELDAKQLFLDTESIKKNWVSAHTSHQLSLTDELRELSHIFEKIKLRIYKIDETLAPSTSAVEARLKHAMGNLEKKLMRAEKRKYTTSLTQIENIKKELFPGNGLQERNENFGLFYVKWGQSFIDELIRNFQPLDFKFTVLSE